VSIREELDPVKMAAERRAKIESLKEQIRNGTYAPPINDVARSVGEEISLEVLFGGDALKAG
jgi:anti-sigma28 factor (negative regulator of flagellin synthesis)